MRPRTTAMLAVLFVLARPACAAAPADEDEVFPVKYIFTGTPVKTQEQCQATPHALWVQAQWLERGIFGDSMESVTECIRYFPSDDAANAKTALLFFSGDIEVERGKGDDTHSPGYAANSYRQQMTEAARNAQRLGVPYIHVARPGMFGSTGNTARYRHSLKEAATMNAAVDALKQQFGYERVSVIGQSGGGGIVGSLLTSGRTDLDCVTSSSGLLSVKLRLRSTAKTASIRPGQDTTGLPLSQVYDSREHLDQVRPDPRRRVFMLADPQDLAVSFVSQKDFADAAAQRNIPLQFMQAKGRGQQHHGTGRIGMDITALCMKGRSDEDIAQRVARERE